LGHRGSIEPASDDRYWGRYDICHFTGSDAGKTRRIEPGSFPLAHGVSGRVGLLRGYGNAIVPQVAAEFIAAYMETDAVTALEDW
jgi:DNA (cytosine-5)-methyltransferase 1